VVSDLLGKVLSYKKVQLDVSCGEHYVLGHVHQEIKDLLEHDNKIQGIGIASSGLIDRTSGAILFWPKVSGWRDVQIKQNFAERYGLITVVEDSARTTALAEQRFGHAKEQKTFVFVNAGVGIGAAIFVNGRLYTGRNGLAGELGHTTIDETGPLCSCGNRGCLEVYASGSAIVEKVRKGLEQGVTSSLAGLVANDHQGVSLEAIAAAAESHDRLSEMTLAEAGTHMGAALASMVNLLNPARIILGGTLPRVTKNLLLEPLKRALRSRAFQQSVTHLEVVISELGEDAAGIGACLLVAEKIMEHLCAFEDSSQTSALGRNLPHTPHLKSRSGAYHV
jgi:predicted NBD/HSP70 family sugar kinase